MQYFSDKTVLVVDDHPAFVNLIKLLLEEIEMKDLHAAGDFDTAWQLFKEHAPDLCILDIDLGVDRPNGIKLAEKIRKHGTKIPIIFLTANYTEDQYRQCRHVYPSAFMNKELSRFKLQHGIDLAFLNQIAASENNLPETNPQTLVQTPFVSNKNLFFKIGDYYKRIPIDQIAFFFAQNKLTFARVENRNFPTTVQLKTLQAELAPGFQRIHKTYLVNVNFIEQIHPKEANVLIMNEQLPIGYAYRKNFLEQVKLLK